MRKLNPGDYVLATKYRDGDPGDDWCIGYFKETKLHDGRHLVVNEAGELYHSTGFRRCQAISEVDADFILYEQFKGHLPSAEDGGLWSMIEGVEK